MAGTRLAKKVSGKHEAIAAASPCGDSGGAEGLEQVHQVRLSRECSRCSLSESLSLQGTKFVIIGIAHI